MMAPQSRWSVDWNAYRVLVPPDGVHLVRPGPRQIAFSDEALSPFAASGSPCARGECLGQPQHWNRYAYALNNPLLFVDPSGQVAQVIIKIDVNSNQGYITVRATIAVYAADGGVSQETVKAAAAQIKAAIEDAWTGESERKGVKYAVKTEVDATAYNSEKDAKKSGAGKVIGLTDGPEDPAHRIDSNVDYRSLFGGPDTGKWNANKLDSNAGHEFTHLLGVEDRTECWCLSNTFSSDRPDHAQSEDFNWALGDAIDSQRARATHYEPLGFRNGGKTVEQNSESTATLRMFFVIGH